MSATMEIFTVCMTFMVSFWVAFSFGILIGWAWRPKWAESLLQAIRSTPCEGWTIFPGRAIGVPCEAAGNKTAPANSRCCPCSSAINVSSKRFSSDRSSFTSSDLRSEELADHSSVTKSLASSVVGEQDLLDLFRKVHGKEGGLSWEQMMERTAPGMTYKAWRRDPQNSPTEYKSRTIFEDSTPELVKDFYWDDEFRSAWDDMLIHSNSKEDCTETGAEIVHWVRKFPFFCSDREYLIGRRIFEMNGAFYCITKVVPYEAVPRRDKPLRVDVYNSSWCIRSAESANKKGQWTACEVIFFHAEDMHIPKNIAKIGVRQGMWGCVRKMEPGLRKYQSHRDTAKSLSKSARMAQLYTRMPASYFDSNSMLIAKDAPSAGPSHQDLEVLRAEEARSGNDDPGWKWLIFGGAVVLACTLDRGVVGRTLVFGLAKKFGTLNQRLR